MSDRYILSTDDRELLSSAELLLRKVLAWSELKPAQLVTVSKLLQGISVLPRVSPLESASVSVICPRHQFGEIRTYHWYEFGVDEGCLRISSAGHFHQPSSGGDTFTTLAWSACPGLPAQLVDNLEALVVVPDARPFSAGVDAIDLTVPGHTVEILDNDNLLLGLEHDEESQSSVVKDSEEVEEDALAASEIAGSLVTAVNLPEQRVRVPMVDKETPSNVLKESQSMNVIFTIRRADAKRALQEIQVNRGRDGADDILHLLVSGFAITLRAVGTESEYPVHGIGPGAAQLPVSIFARAIDMRSTNEIQLRVAPGEIFCGKAVIRHSAITVGAILDLRVSIPINASPFDLLVIDRVLGARAAAEQGLGARLQRARDGLKTALSRATVELADYGIQSADLELLIETAMSEAEPRVREALSS